MSDPKALAARFMADQLWTRRIGERVRFARTVRRDEFTVPAGRVGTIVAPFLADGDLVLAVKLRTPVAGSEPFEGEVHWREGVNLEEVEADLTLA
jgi:hypothetical protein